MKTAPAKANRKKAVEEKLGSISTKASKTVKFFTINDRKTSNQLAFPTKFENKEAKMMIDDLEQLFSPA